MNSVTRIVLVACGTLCVAAGAVGLFVPLLPTTPFLLLAAFCYARGSERFYRWLLANRWFGNYIRNYREGRGVTRRHKTVALILLWLTIGYAAGVVVPIGWVRVLLLVIAAAVTAHLLRLPTCRPPSPRREEYGAPHDHRRRA